MFLRSILALLLLAHWRARAYNLVQWLLIKRRHVFLMLIEYLLLIILRLYCILHWTCKLLIRIRSILIPWLICWLLNLILLEVVFRAKGLVKLIFLIVAISWIHIVPFIFLLHWFFQFIFIKENEVLIVADLLLLYAWIGAKGIVHLGWTLVDVIWGRTRLILVWARIHRRDFPRYDVAFVIENIEKLLDVICFDELFARVILLLVFLLV